MEIVLAVDRDIKIHEQETAEWAKYGIGTQRVDTMSEAITRLTKSSEYFMTVINEDTIPNFLSQLRIMRDASDLPISVLTSSYSVDKDIKAMQHGADVYGPFGASTKEDVLRGLALLKTRSRWAKHQYKSLPVLVGGNIILSTSNRRVFVDDTKVILTRKEFDVLHFLMVNSDRLVPHVKLLKEIWGDTYGEHDTAVLWQTIDRLRKKLSQPSAKNKHILVERGVGYMFSLQ